MSQNQLDHAIVFDVQRFCLHDGPGIRTTVFFKGCPLRCIWCQNPESQKQEPEMAYYADSCQACDRCLAVCPRDAIRRNAPFRIDFERCDACGRCVEACAFRAMRRIGQAWHVDTLLREVLLDNDFFDDSGGGVTLSGGEPLMQAGFLASFLPKLKERGVHVTLETCGVWSWKVAKDILPYVDQVYFDIKHMDPGRHQAQTGTGNGLILENLIRLRAICDDVVPRMAVIPGFNDDPENIQATASFLAANGFRLIHCLAYHRFGESKLARIQTSQKPLHLDAPNMDEVKAVFRSEGIDAILYD